MKYRLICIDIDGTLLDDDKRLSKQNIEAIQKAHGMGIQVALITGRMPAGTDFIEKELQIPCILACNAGTYILKNDKCLSAEYLSVDTMKEIYETVREYHLPLWIFRERSWYVTDVDELVEKETDIVHRKPEVADIQVLYTKWKEEGTGPNKVLIGAKPQKLQRVYARLKSMDRQDVDMACSAPSYLEIFPKGMNKGKALKIICEKEGIREEETLAFGDEELDIPMLEAAGTAVAMGNAIERLKEKADFITKTNNEAGIAYALEHYLSINLLYASSNAEKRKI